MKKLLLLNLAILLSFAFKSNSTTSILENTFVIISGPVFKYPVKSHHERQLFLALNSKLIESNSTSKKKWLEAIIFMESGNWGDNAYNKNEPLAKGKLQQYPIFVKDVNRIIGYERYKLKDRLNSRKAEEMFWIYQQYYNPEMNFEKMCRIQCGGPSGQKIKSTLNYYQIVTSILNNQEIPSTIITDTIIV